MAATRFPKHVLHFCVYCEGAVEFIVSAFTKLFISDFNLEIEAFSESIKHWVADLWAGE